MPFSLRALTAIVTGAVATVSPVRRKSGAIVVVFLGTCLLRIAMLPVRGVPKPAVADEFSYLLMADTFLAGRLANPPLPLAPHFESLFVLSQPTYSSVYPVAQGLILAAGKILTGWPWAGVVLSAGAMCAALLWMLRAWVGARWALIGTMLAVFQFGVSGYWIDSYWGGAHAAIGGSLVLGAIRRMRIREKWLDSALLGLGIAILANSRPWEGLTLSCAALAVLMWDWRREAVSRIWSRLMPAALLCALTAAGMLYYFSRVTGHIFEMPNELYIRQHAIVPVFFCQKLLPEPVFTSPAIRDAMLSFLPDYQRYSSLSGVAGMTVWKLVFTGNFLLGPLVLVPVVMLPWLVRDRAMVPLLVCCAASFAAIAMVVPFQPHYAAPMAPAIVALNAQSLRRLWVARRWGNTLGTYLVPAAPILVVVLFVAGLRTPPPVSVLEPRERLESGLLAAGGLHLVLVHTGPGHSLAKEWIHNGPRIDAERVAWARDLGVDRNRELMRYFSGRTIWTVDPDLEPFQLRKITAAEAGPGVAIR